ncbi:prolactin-releasing peptide receptor-like isoform X3 [Oculina patagonica]
MLNISINNGSQNSSHAWYGFDVGRTLQISLTAMYSITFITALLGNILLLHIIRLHRPFNSVSILISNMAASDLLTALFAMPYSTAYLYVQHRWFGGIMGVISCKIVNFVIGATIAVSVFTLLTISVERYIAVVKPLAYPTFIKRPILLSIAIWFSSVLFMIVSLFTHDVEIFPGEIPLCFMDWETLFSKHSPKIFYSAVAIVLYVLPLFTIAVLSASIIRKLNKTRHALNGDLPTEHASSANRKRNHHVMRMLLVVVTLFAVCWLPVHVLHILINFFGDVYISMSPSVALFLYWVSHANSALNPCVIILLNDSFRKSFMGILRSLCRRNHRVRHINGSPFFICRSHGCLPRRTSRKYSVRWNKREPTSPVTILNMKHEE